MQFNYRPCKTVNEFNLASEQSSDIHVRTWQQMSSVSVSMSPHLPQIKVQKNPLATKIPNALQSPTADPMKEYLFLSGMLMNLVDAT